MADERSPELSSQETKQQEQVEQGSQEQKEEKKGGKKVLIACIVGVAVLAGAVVGIMVSRNRSVEITDISDGSIPLRDVIVHEGNIGTILNEEHVPPGYYEVTMNSTWRFRDGTSVSDNAYVANNRTNTNDVYFDVQLADTEETIYESPVIPRGEYLDEIRLGKDLDAGTYDCVLIYHLIDSSQNTVSTLQMTVTIVVDS